MLSRYSKPGGVSFAPQQITPGRVWVCAAASRCALLMRRGLMSTSIRMPPTVPLRPPGLSGAVSAPATRTMRGGRCGSSAATSRSRLPGMRSRRGRTSSTACRPSRRATSTDHRQGYPKLADDKKSLFPRPSTGTLAADITSGDTTLTASPSGVGNAEYPASGKIAIGGEMMSFTRSGDTFTVTRQFPTRPLASHSADDSIQLVGEFVAQEIQDVIYTLLTDYAGIDTAYIDKPAWDTERDTYLSGVWNLQQPEPVGVNTPLSEADRARKLPHLVG